VDADAVLHPVVVNGRVKQRIGSTSVSADRELIRQLFARDAREVESAGFALGHIPINAQSMPFWHDGYTPAVTVRVMSDAFLPPSIVNRPWMPSATVDAAKAVLDASVLAGRGWVMG